MRPTHRVHHISTLHACSLPLQKAPSRTQLASPTTHAHMRRLERTLTDFLLCLGEREAAQLTHGASSRPPLSLLSPLFFLSRSLSDRQPPLVAPFSLSQSRQLRQPLLSPHLEGQARMEATPSTLPLSNPQQDSRCWGGWKKMNGRLLAPALL